MNILITSVGRRSYLVEYFRKALNGNGLVHVANSSPVSPAFAVADKHVVTPLIYDENYIDFLLDYCTSNSIKAVISLFDVDLPVLAHNKKRFKDKGIDVIVSEEEVIAICNDKWNTFSFLRNHGFHTPASFLTIQGALEAVSSGDVAFPLIVKPRWGMGSIGLYSADNEEELICLYTKVKKTISKSYLKYESAMTPESSVLIQECLDGQEYGLDIINDLEGNYVNTSVKKKIAMRSGETDCAVTVDEPALKKLGERLSIQLRHIANLDVDVFLCDGIPYVLEMNARFGGGYPFSHAAGIDLPLAIIKWLSNEKPNELLFQPHPGVMTQKDIKMTVLEGVFDG